MLGPLINLLLPLSFIAAIAMIIYALVLFIKANRKDSEQLRKKALLMGLLPGIYIAGWLLYFHFNR